ncbi:cation:proton antiporter [Microbispora amethystogenes]|uniref:cation:proton antiporter n=1 Tax=Microbispora amethystogenes TaxID=1427754 RepID=UPI0033C1681B
MPALLQASVALAVILVTAHLARSAAALVRQPPVIGEIALGLVVVPVVTALGSGSVQILPAGDVPGWLHAIGVGGLALYLSGIGHRAQPGRGQVTARSYAWLLGGSLVPGLAAGALLAGWVVWRDDPAERGTAPVVALVLLLTVSLAVTAVPVLVRILNDRGMVETRVGRLAVLTAVSIDALTWLVLALALTVAGTGGRRFLEALAVMIGSAGAAWAVRVVLRRRLVGLICERWPALAAVALGVAAITAASVTERAGLTAIYGAVLVGLAVPWDGEDGPRTRVVGSVARLGRWLVPVFFVTTGLALGAGGLSGFSWATALVTLVLAATAKLAGAYAGARGARLPHREALSFGVLMNTRGLTEFAVLQAGMAAGILTSGLFFALGLMALVTTAATGPLLTLTRPEQKDPSFLSKGLAHEDS